MPEMVLNLPLERSGQKSQSHELFVQISEPVGEGQWWKVTPAEYYPRKIAAFQNAFNQWCKRRNWESTTRTDKEGNLYVRVRKSELEG